MAMPLPSLNVIDVASPCPADWEEMTGNDRTRHCAQCDLNVYNLSEMTEAEALSLVRQTEGRLCVRFFRRADGTVITKDCPVGVRAVRMKVAKVWAATTALAASVVLGSFFPKWTQAREPRPAIPRPDVLLKEIKGDVCIEPHVVLGPQAVQQMPPQQLVKILRDALKAEFDATGGMPDPSQPSIMTEQQRQAFEAKISNPKWQAPKVGTAEHTQLIRYVQQAMKTNPELLAKVIKPVVQPAILGKVMFRPERGPALPKVEQIKN